jgi:hypothetical protein
MSNQKDMNGDTYFKHEYGIPTTKYGKATLRIGKVVLNSHARVTSISNMSPGNKYTTLKTQYRTVFQNKYRSCKIKLFSRIKIIYEEKAHNLKLSALNQIQTVSKLYSH